MSHEAKKNNKVKTFISYFFFLSPLLHQLHTVERLTTSTLSQSRGLSYRSSRFQFWRIYDLQSMKNLYNSKGEEIRKAASQWKKKYGIMYKD